MKIYRSVLAACVAGSLLSGISQRSSAQEISKPTNISRTSGDFSGLRSSKPGNVGSLSIPSGETLSARQARISRKSGSLQPRSLLQERQSGFSGLSTLSTAGIVSPGKLTLSPKQSAFGETFRSSKVGDRGRLSRSPVISARSSKFRVGQDASSISSGLLTQPRLVK